MTAAGARLCALRDLRAKLAKHVALKALERIPTLHERSGISVIAGK